MALLHECLARDEFTDPDRLARPSKALPLRLIAPRRSTKAISSAGGVAFEALDDRTDVAQSAGRPLRRRDARLGSAHRGYLLTGCFASGYTAGQAVLASFA